MAEPIDVLKALSDYGRLRILKALEVRSLCVCEITQLIGLATSTISSHLNQLKNAGLIADKKDGKWINYTLVADADPFAAQLWRIISERLDRDSLIGGDRERVALVDRVKICREGK